MDEQLIKLENISKDFIKKGQKICALNAIDLEITSGEMVALIGPSAAGKSTILSILAGLIQPTTGCYLFKRTPLSYTAKDLAQFREQNIGILPQKMLFIDDLDVYHNIALPLKYAKKTATEIESKVKEITEILGIADRHQQYPHELSGGEAQRVALARAIIKDPPLILADEPTTFLDQHNCKIVWEVLEWLNKHGSTIIFTTHDLTLANKCPHIVTLDHGKIISA